MIYSCQTPNGKIEYEVKYSSRRKTVAISINRTKTKVSVLAPYGFDMCFVDKIIYDKSDWIFKKLSEVVLPVAMSYENGSKHLLLGKEYNLITVIGKSASCRVEGENIYLTAMRQPLVEKVLKKWYLKKANELFAEIVADDVINFSKNYGRSPRNLEYKIVKSYWGICRQDGSITLNAELVRARPEHIRYIMCHELCHLVQRNHSAKFYELLTKVCPNWEELKNELNKLVKI